MRVPVPEAPEMTAAAVLWAMVAAGVIFCATVSLALVAQWAAIIPSILLLLACLYLLGGQMLNAWLDR